MTAKLTKEQVLELMRQGLPQLLDMPFTVEEVGPDFARARLAWRDAHVRPGGTVSGPTQMALADAAMYAAILATLGPELMAVTTDITMHFVRRPPPADLLAEARIIKRGQRLLVLTVSIVSVEHDHLVAHAVGTYALPAPRREVAARCAAQ